MKTSSVVFVPPRPNPGPEAFEDRGIGVFWLLAGCLIALGSALAIYVVRVRFRKRRASLQTPGQAGLSATTTPAADLASLVREVRGRLAEHCGEGIRAKTTEELAADITIMESLGLEGTSNLIGFLRATDVMRFGSASRDDTQRLFDAWSDWAEGFCSAAGARSTTKGK